MKARIVYMCIDNSVFVRVGTLPVKCYFIMRSKANHLGNVKQFITIEQINGYEKCWNMYIEFHTENTYHSVEPVDLTGCKGLFDCGNGCLFKPPVFDIHSNSLSVTNSILYSCVYFV